jgi:Tol biopolymer transport system component
LNNSYVLFSPDGKQAAYINYQECSWLVDYEKKELRPLDCPGVSSENHIAPNEVLGWYSNQPDILIMLFDSSGPGMGGRFGYLGTLSLSDGTEKVLDSQHAISSIELSPDGKTIAYDDGTYSGLYSSDAGIESFDPRQYGIGDFTLTNPAWSPDGKKIAWGLMDANSEFKLAVGIFDLESKTAQVLHPHSLALVGLDGPPQTPSPIWSPDGQWVAFYAGVFDKGGNHDEKQSGWWTLRADGSAEYKLDGEFYNWSPDGQWIISWKKENPDSTTATLMAAHPDGADETAITEVSIDQYGQIQGRVAWAPDGNRLLLWMIQTRSGSPKPDPGN